VTAPKHPGRTPAQRRALDAIGCGNENPIMARSTRDALLRTGLVERLQARIIGGGGPSVRIERFDMPIPVHMAWCEAMAASVTDEEIGL
jgi:hypothetical protein